MSAPDSLLRAWFAAHDAGDMPAARALLADGAVVRVPGEDLHGFDEFMTWYANRRASMPGFRYEVLDILGGESHAAAVIQLHDGDTTWRQIAVYEVEDGRLASVALYEDEPRAITADSDTASAHRAECRGVRTADLHVRRHGGRLSER